MNWSVSDPARKRVGPFRSRFPVAILALTFPSAFAGEFSWSTLLPLREERGVVVSVERGDSSGRLRLLAGETVDPGHNYSWVTFPSPEDGWDLSRHLKALATIRNEGEGAVEVMLWFAGRHGWSAVGDFAVLKPAGEHRFEVDLREKYPDGTPKVDPSDVVEIRLMFRGAKPDLNIAAGAIEFTGEAPEWLPPADRVMVPPLEEGAPAPGKRVRFFLEGDGAAGVYSVLYLPPSWKAGGRYPLIVEYPGNIFFNAKCFSTGRPEQCVIGYGMTKGEGSIVLSLPFMDRSRGGVVESGFGNADETTAYAKKIVETVIERFAADRENMVLTGFSRGSIACGYIGLRDEEIAAFWKGIHGCQHYDGSPWRESTMEDAVVRAKRFQGAAIFQTDNQAEKYRPVVEATRAEVEWTWVNSRLGFHATAMFLDDRPSTVQLREWYQELISSP